MDGSLSGVVVAALAFALAFGIARAVVAWVNRRRRARVQDAGAAPSRQVRRAQARKRKG